ncbi:glutamate--tRNA ligase [Ornithobacterium rhinotracheale]|uniref:Glutamate--tRNA ligase n=1 Tax=Ornithobacterium rhinotracheale TaxID=28251 RepID=A0A410JPB3_ORNRH|nr:glutamate--tRNA ligase [Ornithobacterium rhinotracheale]QAR29976.1 glutamate--tRNA ligase [Ornithobacterium rhinotracheale]
MVRVRFAPSPTGPLHMGGVRTALFNYLFAKKHNGEFILRIEDTDQKRFVPQAEEYIIESLKWTGLLPDEGQGFGGKYGPYRQSERAEIYQEYIQILLDNGKAYYAFDTPEELENLRKQAEQRGEAFSYNQKTRMQLNNSLNLSAEQVQQYLSEGKEYVIRFKIPASQELHFNDIIRGNLHINTETLDDKVLFKSDGLPTYHFANIVDDHLMLITHVIRGEEWLPSMPLHILLYQAFDWEAPKFAHLPLILNPEGKGKLSKRDGDKFGFPVFPLEWKTENGISMGYRENGYLPQAFVNMLALLGWNPGTEEEIFSLEELCEKFDLNKVSKSGARFNPEKAVWFNHQYLQKESTENLVKAFQAILAEHNVVANDAFDTKVVELLKERANFVKDLWAAGSFLYQAPESYDEKALKKVWKDDTAEILNQFLAQNEKIENYNAEEIHHAVQDFVAAHGIGFGKIMMPLRLALVGALQGPDIPVIMELLGKDEVQKRVQNFLQAQG